jgi:flagellin-like hook-associated protein FlgL
MPSILNNVTAMQASRQIGVTQMGLKQAIERLTTGKRINRASDDAAGMAAGNTAEASARSSKESIKGFQVAYFTAQAADGAYEEATDLSYRLAELEGSSNQSVGTEYSTTLAAVNAITGGTDTNAAGALGTIATARQGFAAQMSSAQSSANLAGIRSENAFAISDTWIGADIGAEMVNLTKYQIMMQAGTSALSNANQSSQTVLGLFR